MRILKITLYLSLTLLITSVGTAKIVFVKYLLGSNEIFVMDDDGTNITQITHDEESEYRPRWSPDGTQIAFFRDTDPTSTVRANTFIMNADGTNVRRLTFHDSNDRHLSFSPDGKKLAVSRTSRKEGVYIIDIESGETEHVASMETYGIDWSPDGNLIVFTNYTPPLSQSNIWSMNVDGTNPRPFIPPFPEKNTAHRSMPRWSPDGAHIMYSEIDLKTKILEHPDGSKSLERTYAGTFRIQILNINDRNVMKLRIPSDSFLQSVAWMDGDKAVLFSSAPFRDEPPYDEIFQLYKYDIATGAITQLTHDTRGIYHGDWVSDDPSAITPVSPKGKLPSRWGELKKSLIKNHAKTPTFR